MNKQGQIIFYGLMMGIVLIILALALAYPLRQSTDIAMNSSSDTNLGMDCSNESISDFDKITCYATDLTPFYFVGIIIMIGGIFFLGKIIFAE
jgi:Trk-type K+ transport system membrane component